MSKYPISRFWLMSGPHRSVAVQFDEVPANPSRFQLSPPPEGAEHLVDIWFDMSRLQALAQRGSLQELLESWGPEYLLTINESRLLRNRAVTFSNELSHLEQEQQRLDDRRHLLQAAMQNLNLYINATEVS